MDRAEKVREMREIVMKRVNFFSSEFIFIQSMTPNEVELERAKELSIFVAFDRMFYL